MKNFDAIKAALLAADYADTGGGNDFTSYAKADRPEVFLFAGARGSGPETSHWAAIDPSNQDVILIGGFTAESLKMWLDLA